MWLPALPSAQVLTDLAKGLNLAPEALIRMATWLPNAITGDDKDAVINAIAKDKRLKESQRQAHAAVQIDGRRGLGIRRRIRQARPRHVRLFRTHQSADQSVDHGVAPHQGGAAHPG